MEESMENIGTVTVAKVENVGEEDSIKIKTEECCIQLVRTIKTEEENSMDLGETVPSVCGEMGLTNSADGREVSDINAEEVLQTQEDDDRLAVTLAAVKAADKKRRRKVSPNFTSRDESRSSVLAKKRVRLLKARHSSELFMDSDSDSDESDCDGCNMEEEGGYEEAESELLLKQGHSLSRSGHTACCSIDVPHSPSSSSASAEDDHGQIKSDLQTLQKRTTFRWRLPSCPQERVVHTFMGGPCGRKDAEAPHITESSTPLSVFLLYFSEIITLLVVETNRYYHRCLDTLDQGPSTVPDITEAEMFVFLAVTIQMGHCLRERVSDYWCRMDQFYTPFYSNVMKRDRYFHILRFLNFSDNRNNTHKTDKSSGRLWKMGKIFEIVDRTFSKFYNPSEHLTIDQVVVLFKGRVVFKHCMPKKRKCFLMKIYKLCDSNGYTYEMKVHLEKDQQRAAPHLTAAHAIVTELTRKVEGRGHKLYLDSFFSSPALFDDLTKKKINCCGTVKPNRRGMPRDLESEKMKLKQGDIKVRTRGDLTAIVWRDRKDVHILTNIHAAPAEGNFRDEQGNAETPLIVADYNHHMNCMCKGNRKANSYTISRPNWKWAKKLFFHVLDLAILNSYILLSSCGGKKISHRDFRLSLVRNMLAHARQKQQLQRRIGRPAGTVDHVVRLECSDSEHWPIPSDTRVRCRVCSARGVTRNVDVKCLKCGVGLCSKKFCFMEYHTEAQL